MKLLCIAKSYLSTYPSDMAGVFVHRQFLALKAIGWDIRVICPQAFLYRELKGIGRYYPHVSLHDGILVWRPRFIWLPTLAQYIGPTIERFYALAVARVMSEVTREWEPDVVIGDWLIPGGYSAVQTARRFGIPLILRARGHDVLAIVSSLQRSTRHRQHYQRVLGAADRIVCQGQGLYEELTRINQETDLFNQSRAIVMTNGIDTALFCPATPEERLQIRNSLGLPLDAQVWLYIGRWERPKGCRELTAALRNVLPRFPNIHILVAGPIHDTQSRNVLRGFSDRVHFLGPQEPHRIGDLLRASDIFVLPTHREGLPNSLLEAMASGLVVIATRVGGIPFVVTHNRDGILIEARNILELERALACCAENLAAYRHLGATARRTIFEKHLDLTSVTLSVHSLLCSLVDKHNETKRI